MAGGPVILTTINVKDVDPEAWKSAKNQAKIRGESMGEWLNRKAREGDGAGLETGQVSVNPPPTIAEITALLASAGSATGIGSRLNRDAVTSISAFVDTQCRAGVSEPPRPKRKRKPALAAPAEVVALPRQTDDVAAAAD